MALPQLFEELRALREKENTIFDELTVIWRQNENIIRYEEVYDDDEDNWYFKETELECGAISIADKLEEEKDQELALARKAVQKKELEFERLLQSANMSLKQIADRFPQLKPYVDEELSMIEARMAWFKSGKPKKYKKLQKEGQRLTKCPGRHRGEYVSVFLDDAVADDEDKEVKK